MVCWHAARDNSPEGFVWRKDYCLFLKMEVCIRPGQAGSQGPGKQARENKNGRPDQIGTPVPYFCEVD
jgi:hypothetical protein